MKFALIASVSVAALSLLTAPAFAQCTPNPPNPGDTVTCAAGGYPTISFAVADLTLVVGDAVNPVAMGGAVTTAVELTGSGNQTLVIPYANSPITANTYGIRVSSSGTGNVSISHAGTITAGVVGIAVVQNSAGSLDITTTNTITSNNFGIATFAGAATTDITINSSGNIYGANNGIFVDTQNTGDLTINAGFVQSTNAYSEAIYVYSRNASAGAINITANDLRGAGSGVFVAVSGGASSINVDAAYITSSSGVGAVLEGGTNTDISFTSTGSVTASNMGVRVTAIGTGTTSIIANQVTSTADHGVWVSASNHDVIMDLGTVSGVPTGVFINKGTGSGNITLTADTVSASTGNAVRIEQTGGNGSIDVNVGDANSPYDTVDLYLLTTTNDAITITRGDLVAGSLRAVDVNVSGLPTITNTGMALRTYGTGDLTINLNGGAYSSAGEGVFWRSRYIGGVPVSQNMTLTAAAPITAADYGIFIRQGGAGETHVSVTDVSGGPSGIFVYATEGSSAGAISITSTGHVSAEYFSAIVLQHAGGSSAPLTVSAHDVTALGTVASGITVIHGFSPVPHDVAITVTGTINATSAGIQTSLFGDSNGVTITANNIYAANAVAGQMSSNGGISITTTGTVTGGINLTLGTVTHTGSATDVGFELDTAAALPTVLTATGPITGERFGLELTTTSGTQLTVGSGASIYGSTAAARFNGSSNDALIMAGDVLADVLMLGGSDSFTLQAGGDIASGARVDLGTGDDDAALLASPVFMGNLRGGLGTDTLTLGAVTGTLGQTGYVVSNIRQFEILEAVSGADWTLQNTQFNYTDANFRSGSTVTLDSGGRLFADTVLIEDGAALNLANTSSINRSIVQLNGALYIGGSGTTGSASVQGTLTIGATGILNMDALASGDNDLLRLTGLFANQGTINVDGTLNLNQTYALEEGTYTLINAVQALNGTFATVNGLGSGGGFTQSLEYTAQNRVNVVTEFTGAMTPENTGSKSSASAANYLLGQLGDSSEYSQLGFDVGTMASVAEIGNFAAGITPDILDSAVMVSDGAALRFGQSLAGCDMNFSLNASESCAAVDGQSGPALFGEMKLTSANTGTEVGHNFNAQSFDMTVGVRLTDVDDRTQFGLMSSYAKSGSVSDAIYAPSSTQNTPLTPAQAGAYGECAWAPVFTGVSGGERSAKLADGLEAETFSLGGYARRDLGWWSLDGTAMVSTSEAKLVRNITPGLGIAEQAQSEFVSRQFNLQGTATLNGLGETEFWIKPLATVGNRTLQRDGFTESGAELLGLTVDGQTRNVSYAGLGAEFAPDFTDEQGNGFRGLLRVTGLAYTGDTANDFTARFTNAPGDDSFTYFGQGLDSSILLESGFQYIAGDGFAIGAEGFGEINPETGDSSTIGATLQLIKRW